MCYNCGAVLNDANIVAEITFGENAAGAAVVQGGFVGENQRYANTMGANVRGYDSAESRTNTQNRGLEEISKLANALGLPEAVRQNAGNWYKLAINHSFVQGRRVRNVAAVALYLAARKQPENTLMLMDLAEKVMCNVWALGDTYKQFCRTIMEKDPGQLDGRRTVQEIEPLMLKFCRKLEFHDYSHRVANDACILLKRMKRDWMVQGRNPAGLCGACIILAARMNNFRRTVREVVYVVKVADTTINARLHEYRRTPSSALTVNQFRKFGPHLKTNMQPPSVYKRQEREARAEERKRKAAEEPDVEAERENEDNLGHDAGSSSQGDPSNTRKRPERASKKRKLNKGKAKEIQPQGDVGGQPDEAAIPELDALDAALAQANVTEEGMDVNVLEDNSHATLGALTQANITEDGMDVNANTNKGAAKAPKKRGRKPKKCPPVIIPEEELEIERELEHEIEETVKDWESTFKEFANNDNHEVLVRASDRARQLVQLHMTSNVSDDAIIGEDEFEDDPDVANCLLSEYEKRNKEVIWVTENEDWLRAQQQKLFAKALEEARGNPPKARTKRKNCRMGDGRLLEGEGELSAAQAVEKMMKKRGKHFSSAINYEKLLAVMPATDSGRESRSSSSSPEASGSQQAAPTPKSNFIQVTVGDDDDEEDEEEDEGPYNEQTYEDDEDLENEHRYEEEAGINEEDYYEDY